MPFIVQSPTYTQHESAEAEVERLCDIVERAAEALKQARHNKRAAQKELNAAAKVAQATTSSRRAVAVEHSPDVAPNGYAASTNGTGDSAGQETDESRSEYSDDDNENGGYEDEDESGEEDDDDYEEDEEDEEGEEGEEDEEDEEDEVGGFDMGNEALEQVRYRLETAKIDPNSPMGTKLLDELLIRLQDAEVEVIDAALVNEFIDKLLFDTEEGAEEAGSSASSPPPQNPKHPDHPVIRIYRGGKVLGWYQGELDERGYARQGTGSMYYDAGHVCHGTWENDEMVGRGTYKWSDGHVYDGDWSNGKRHGLGRFNRPDNVILYGQYANGHHKGEGVRWSADRKEAQLVVDGVPMKSVSLTKANEIATNLGFVDALPPPM
jgi:hypothetical protein